MMRVIGWTLMALGLILFVVGCAPVEPGTLMRTVRQNDDRRATQACMEAAETRALFPTAARRVCERQSVLRQMYGQWQDCINEAELDCGREPTMIDVVKAGY